MMQVLNTSEKLKPENFVYWLQGFAEIAEERPSEKQWKIIREHLELCFGKFTVEPSVQQITNNTISTANGNPLVITGSENAGTGFRLNSFPITHGLIC